MPTTSERVRSSRRALTMAASTLGLLNAANLRCRLIAEPKRYITWQKHMIHWCKTELRVFGVDHELVGPPPASVGGARLVVCNHRSPLDILLMLHYFGGHVLSRADLAGWPVLGVAARNADTIFVDRDNPRSGVKAIREIRKRLKAGRTVIVFPEGTTLAGDEVRPFVGGAFAAIRGLDVQLVPVGIAYDAGAEFVDETFMEHISRVAARPVTRVRICVGDPMAAEGAREKMALEMRERCQGLVGRARTEL